VRLDGCVHADGYWLWYIAGVATVAWGTSGDLPV
jgi:hypothetical protein